MAEVQKRFKDDLMKTNFHGIFPTDNPRNIRFSINYFTSIGMGGLTEEMRDHLRNAPKPTAIMPTAKPESDSESLSSYSSYSSYTGSSRPLSESRSPSRTRTRHQRSGSPPRSRRHYTSSMSHTPPKRGLSRMRNRRSLSRSLTPPRRYNGRAKDRSPPRRKNARARSYTSSDYSSRSPAPAHNRKGRNPSYSSRSLTPPTLHRRRGS